MADIKFKICYPLFSVLALLLCASCHHDEPETIKPAEERTILVLNSQGQIFDQTGNEVMQLPNCTYAGEIISDGDDYFVSGIQSKGRVGYWKNGKWNTLHIDFIDDVEHLTSGIAKWDYYIFLLDIPNVLKNSGIFPLEDCTHFIPADHGLRVSEGKCYVVGYALSDDERPFYQPVLYTNYEKEILPLPADATGGECHALYAYDRDHTVIGGRTNTTPIYWVDKEYHVCECSYPELTLDNGLFYGSIEAITMCNGHIYAAGFEFNEDLRLVATMWTDGVPVHFVSEGSTCYSSQAVEIYSYGNDLYLLTSEYFNDTDQYVSHLWVNGQHVMAFPGIEATGFTVL